MQLKSQETRKLAPELDPYQMNNLSLEENQEVVKDLCAEMGKVLKEIDDPGYKEGRCV